MIEKMEKLPDGDYLYEDTHYQDAEAIFLEMLGICGCASNEILDYILDILEELDDNRHRNDIVTEFTYGVLDGADFLTHGTSIRFPFLTEKGKELLSDLKQLRRE